MPNRLKTALLEQKEQNQQRLPIISGRLGIPLGGSLLVEVPNRNSFVYVQLRDNQNEVIQAFNNKVAPSYGLPVLVQREGTRYIVLGVDTQRYQNNWNSFAPYLPRHGNTHSFVTDIGGGSGDITWIYSRQFMPLLTIPSGSSAGPSVVVSPHVLQSISGTWNYVGNTGTTNLLQYLPTGSNAVMVLVYLDRLSGNPQIIVNSGSYFPNSITGTAEITPYIPNVPNPYIHVPLGAVRLTTGTSLIGWDNIYDTRQYLQYITTGTNFTVDITNIDGFAGLYDGVSIGTGTLLNVRGQNVQFTKSGSMFDLFITGSLNVDTIGFAGLYNGVPLGTGTFLNVRGTPVSFTKSGSMFDLFITGSAGGGQTVNSDGIMAWDEGTPLGTGSIINFVGAGVTATISGTVINVDIPGGGGGGGGAGIVGRHLGGFVATGTVLDVEGSLTASGTVLSLVAQKTLMIFTPPILGTTAYTNLLAADTAGNNANFADLYGYTQARLFGYFGGVNPNPGTLIHMKYSTNNGASFSELALNPDTKGRLPWTSGGFNNTGWFDIATNARTNGVWIRIYTTGGNGAIDPTFNNIGIDFH